MKSIKKLLMSFKYAISGLFYCIKTCRNFRIHTVAAVFVLYFSTFYSLTTVEYSLLFLLIGLVIAAECLNTAFEQLCNFMTGDYSKYIKHAKDCAAAAVLCVAIASVLIAIKLFINIDVFYKIFEYYSSPTRIIFLCISVVLSIIYIFYEDIFKNAKQ